MIFYRAFKENPFHKASVLREIHGKSSFGSPLDGSTLGPFLGSMGPHEPIWTLYREKNSFFEWNNVLFHVIPIDR